MPSISSFISLSLDGCYADANGDMSWAHSQDPEQQAFTNSNAKGGGRLVFGRATYDMMAAFWPTPAAAQMMPEVAKGMNAMPKDGLLPEDEVRRLGQHHSAATPHCWREEAQGGWRPRDGGARLWQRCRPAHPKPACWTSFR